MDELESRVKRLSLDNVEQVLKVATPEEKKRLEPIVTEKRLKVEQKTLKEHLKILRTEVTNTCNRLDSMSNKERSEAEEDQIKRIEKINKAKALLAEIKEALPAKKKKKPKTPTLPKLPTFNFPQAPEI